MIVFPPHRLDLRTERLWRHDELVTLRPKTWAVLRYLVEHPFILVGKDELIAAVWGVAAVSDDALTRTIGELRHALGDNARMPAILQTVHGRGFRFIAPLWHESDTHVARAADGTVVDMPFLVGRDAELAQLHDSFRAALERRRQVVFVSGEPGVGTSTLVARFLHGLRSEHPTVPVAWGQAVEQFGSREPFRPALEALERLLAGVDGARLRETLRTSAPSWLAQLPSPAGTRDGKSIRSTVSPYRMLREFRAFTERAASDTPLVLVLEDLHWSDFGTVDLLKTVAEGQEACELLVIASYQPPEAVAAGHPIEQVAAMLEGRGATALPLKGLSLPAIGEYLRHRLAPWPVDDDVTALVAEHTHGNPLFMGALVNHFLNSGRLVQQPRWTLLGARQEIVNDVPEDLAQMLDRQLRRITPQERSVLEAASVAGMTFDVREVAAALEVAEEEVQRRCQRLARAHRLLSTEGSAAWPDGTTCARYAFVHAPYRRVLYDAIAPSRRATLHQRIGARLERGHAAATTDVAAELANHFQQSHDQPRAIRYLSECADRASSRRAYRDAITFIESALPLVSDLPPSPELRRQELQLRRLYGNLLAYTEGYASERLLENLRLARALCAWHAEESALFDVLYILATFHAVRGDLDDADALSDDLLRLARTGSVPASWRANLLRGLIAFWTGDLATSEAQLALVKAASMTVPPDLSWSVVDPILTASSYDNLRLWVCGEPDRARALQDETIAIAERSDHPFTAAHAATVGAALQALGTRWDQAHGLASKAIRIADEYGFPRWSAIGRVGLGRALVGLGERSAGVQAMEQGLDALHRNHERFGNSLLRVLHADALGQLGEIAEGLAAVDRGLALCRDTGECVFEGELLRLKGELLLAAHPAETIRGDADACFTTAITRARQMGATTLEQRARASAARLTGGPLSVNRDRQAGTA